MNYNTTKIKLVFVPYMIISLATVIGWTFLHWLLFIKLNIWPVNEWVKTIIVPFVLSVTSIFIWLRQRLDLLRLPIITKKTYGDKFFYCFVAIIAMVTTSFFSQQYIELTTANVTQLSSIDQIEHKEPERFYSLKNFYLDKKHFSIKKQFIRDDRRRSLNMYLYITVPILNSAEDTLGSNCIGWYGVQYLDIGRGFMDRHLKGPSYYSDSNFNDVAIDTIENSKEFKRFVSASMREFGKLNLNQFLYLNRISETGDYDSYALASKKDQQGFNRQLAGDYENYILAIKNNTKYDTKSDAVLLPANEPLADRANDNLIIALAVFGLGSLLFLIMVISPKLKSEMKYGK